LRNWLTLTRDPTRGVAAGEDGRAAVSFEKRRGSGHPLAVLQSIDSVSSSSPREADLGMACGAGIGLRLAAVAVACACVSGAIGARAWAAPGAVPAQGWYEYRSVHDPDGIGKFYFGREIAHVMGHQAADWLERPERELEERPELMVQSLALKPGDAAVDLGAGTGYFTRRLAREVGPKGIVYAVDLQPEMLVRLTNDTARLGLTNVRAVLATIEDPKLRPRSADLVLMVDVYHELSHPYEVMTRVCAALKPRGRVAFVEYRAEDPEVPIKRLHKLSEAQLRKEMQIHPLDWVETVRVLPRQHLVIFRRRGS
jgi:SAM-dependent methyltransferase